MASELDTNKPGYKTTEAVVPVVAGILGSLVAFGVLSPDDQEAGVKIAGEAIGSLTALAGMAVYVWGRVRIKLEKIKTLNS
ncbi:MAG: hypothetical protein KAV87_09455 [Desulfobacteraceae bacterium]|nr:hypothetical protein [Desulfobacteraceae bacterium]